MISLTGSAMTSLAVPWFVLVTTGSAAKTGITGAVSILPAIIAGIFGGTLVDRVGFKRISVSSDLLSVVAVALIPILYHSVGLSFLELLLLLFLSKLLSVPGETGRKSLVPNLAGLADMPLERANSLYSSAFNSSSLFGPIIGGVLIVAFGASNVLFIDSGSFLVSAALIGLLVPAAHSKVRRREQSDSYFSELREGVQYLRDDHLTLVLALVMASVNFVLAPLISVVLPVYARWVLGNAFDLGIALGAAGAGTLAGALLYGMVGTRLPRRSLFIGAFLVMALPLMALALLPNIIFVAILLASAGVAAGPINPMCQTLLQERVPEEMFGRVFGLGFAITWIAMPLGMVVAGPLLEYTGLRTTILLETSTFLLIALGLLLMPSLRELD
jgi:predicted MFS family arabinose efflux permease